MAAIATLPRTSFPDNNFASCLLADTYCPFILHTDASDLAIGAVVLQADKLEQHAVSYEAESRVLRNGIMPLLREKHSLSFCYSNLEVILIQTFRHLN